MRKIYLSSIAISASLFNSCGTSNTNSNISEESLKYINNNLNNLEKAETCTELETIAKKFKDILKISDRK